MRRDRTPWSSGVVAFYGRVPSGPDRSRLRRWPQRRNRVSLDRGSRQPAASIGRRSRRATGIGDRVERGDRCGPRCKNGEREHSDRVRDGRLSGQVRAGREVQTGRKSHGRQFPAQRACGQARSVARPQPSPGKGRGERRSSLRHRFVKFHRNAL
jgi:hypothetical protein